MEIEVGEYIRTQLGDIKQITEGFEFIIELHNKSSNKIVKHSKNIIDLIEEYDFVNEEEVDKIKIDENGEKYIKTVFNNVFRNKDIKTILTKEQYEQNSYKIGE